MGMNFSVSSFAIGDENDDDDNDGNDAIDLF